jgi:hypothetical protein
VWVSLRCCAKFCKGSLWSKLSQWGGDSVSCVRGLGWALFMLNFSQLESRVMTSLLQSSIWILLPDMSPRLLIREGILARELGIPRQQSTWFATMLDESSSILRHSSKFEVMQQIWNDLCELKFSERNWHNISQQGSRNSKSDIAAFTLSSWLLLCVNIVKLPWGQPFWGDFAKSFSSWNLQSWSDIQMWGHKMFWN